MSGDLREQIAQTIQGAGMVIGPVSAGHLADRLLAGPLQPLVAAAEERDALRTEVVRLLRGNPGEARIPEYVEDDTDLTDDAR